MNDYQHLTHEFNPVFDDKSKVLILGSFPSVKSREQGFYYGHPQNRFWKVLCQITNSKENIESIDKKKAFLLKNRIAIWDVINQCDIIGSDDNSIKNVTINNIKELIDKTDIKVVCCNGALSYKLFIKYVKLDNDLPIIKLPSSSPANAAYSVARLVEKWQIIEKYRGEK